MKQTTEAESFQQLALLMAATCVRNTCIEEFHARPGGLTDTDMKRLNQEVAGKLYTFLHYLLGGAAEREKLINALLMYYPTDWDQPSLNENFVAAIEGKDGANLLFRDGATLPKAGDPPKT